MKKLLATVIILWMTGHIAMALAETSALVKTGMMEKRTLSSSLEVYGTISPDPRYVEAISLARAGKVSRIMVTTGQIVKRGSQLLEFSTDPAESAAYEQAKLSVDYLQKELQRTEMMVQQHLSTQTQLATARKSFADALSNLDILRKQGKETLTEKITAPFAGIITRLDVNAGDHVPPKTLLLHLAKSDSLMADMEVEPEEIYQVKTGMLVHIRSIFDRSQMVKGRVFSINGVINPQTRRVSVLVQLFDHPAEHFIPGMYILGEIITGKQTYQVVPRSAVLRDEKGAYIYQISDSHAIRINVTTGKETDRVIAVQGHFNPSLKIVVQGNYELEDKMMVREDAK